MILITRGRAATRRTAPGPHRALYTFLETFVGSFSGLLHVVRFALWSTKNSRPFESTRDSQPVGSDRPGDITPSRSSVGAYLLTSPYLGGPAPLRFWCAAGSSKNSMSWAFGTECRVPTQRQSSLSWETVSAPRRSRVAPLSSARTRSFVGRATLGGGAKGSAPSSSRCHRRSASAAFVSAWPQGVSSTAPRSARFSALNDCCFCGAGASSRGRLLPECWAAVLALLLKTPPIVIYGQQPSRAILSGPSDAESACSCTTG